MDFNGTLVENKSTSIKVESGVLAQMNQLRRYKNFFKKNK